MKERTARSMRRDQNDVCTYILRMTYALFVGKQTDRTISRSKDGRVNNETNVEQVTQLQSIGIHRSTGALRCCIKKIGTTGERRSEGAKEASEVKEVEEEEEKEERIRDIRRKMSLHLETNKWTPKLIIVFQLTVWSIIGIILLQKGAISLREKMMPRNDTADVQDELAKWNGKELTRETRTNVRDETGTRRRTNLPTDNVDDVASNERLPRKLHIVEQVHFKKRTTAAGHEHDARGTRAIQTLSVHLKKQNQVKNISNEENVIVPVAPNKRPYNTGKHTLIHNIKPMSVLFDFEKPDSANLTRPDDGNSFEHEVNNTTPYESTENGQSETKPRRSPVNRIGAAIAIIMLAIGIVMLLLGPFIVILRALSNRRRTREMLRKKRNQNDRPPTYEEATLMDQVPRYSTLQLDTIPESSSSL